ncbi:MAG TPA: ADP-ribosylglycohydrolase family protein [Thermoanaerobaculia bacterium]|nr:ADP-ribosylglycohydrolase family protein [Thermoanaerobaculia bacterium]
MTARTSASDPLEVGFIDPASPGASEGVPLPPGSRLGLTLAPGKKQANPASGPAWHRDLDADLFRLRAHHGVDVLVSLTEDHELDALAIPELGRATRLAGMEHLRFPIRDQGVPADGHAFRQLVEQVVWRLRRQRTVVVHCKGGQGRSGVAAAAALVLLGDEPRRAIERARAARPGAIENDAQEDFVERFPELLGSGEAWERIAGCLLGGAVGDALGAGVELQSLGEIRDRHGPAGASGYVEAYGRRGAITDDTQMTLFTAEGLLRAHVRGATKGVCHPPSVVHHALLRWLHTQGRDSALFGELRGDTELCGDAGGDAEDGQPDGWLIEVPELHSERAPGRTCLHSLGVATQLGQAAINDSKGCGDIMRSAPCGLLAASPAIAFDLAADCCRLTHGHPTGQGASGYFAELIHLCLRAGGARVDLRRAAQDVLRRRRDRLNDEVRRAVYSALAAADAVTSGKEALSAESVERLGAGWVSEEALAIGLFSALVGQAARDFRAGALLAVNHSGDSDSTGAIAGNLMGVAMGVGAIPRELLDELELREVIETVARDGWAVAGEGAELAWERYPGW